MLVEDSERFGLSGGGRVLGVLGIGAGTGLVSLALAKLRSVQLSAIPDMPGHNSLTTIVASDYHPVVLKNLEHNIQANFPDGTPPNASLTTLALDWSDYSTSPESAPVNERTRPDPFDLIIGADVVYEPTHARWVRDCASALLRTPSESPASDPRFHLVIPLRPTHAYEYVHYVIGWA